MTQGEKVERESLVERRKVKALAKEGERNEYGKENGERRVEPSRQKRNNKEKRGRTRKRKEAGAVAVADRQISI